MLVSNLGNKVFLTLTISDREWLLIDKPVVLINL